ncbi:response regulator transcription factor [Chloroflexota bacterium]
MEELRTIKQPPCIMVVDDEKSILELLTRFLESEGYRVITTSNSQSALALLKEQRPDLLILDIMMPEPNGLVILHHVRQHSDVPVIILTAREEDTIVQSSIIVGANDYVKKPFNLPELLSKIRVNLECASSKKNH